MSPISSKTTYRCGEDGAEFEYDAVPSVSNTAVIFDTNTEHRGVPSTDTRRLVLNINYFEK